MVMFAVIFILDYCTKMISLQRSFFLCSLWPWQWQSSDYCTGLQTTVSLVAIWKAEKGLVKRKGPKTWPARSPTGCGLLQADWSWLGNSMTATDSLHFDWHQLFPGGWKLQPGSQLDQEGDVSSGLWKDQTEQIPMTSCLSHASHHRYKKPRKHETGEGTTPQGQV